uniref:Uncharacterized protein n=1 Tax=viral metagenome TaxID=1070528 RepID=A0A6M3KVL9_9ZZZZ
MSANSGYIIIKGATDGDKVKKEGIKSFYGPLDKGSAKPSFCYPVQKEALREEVRQMEKSLNDGYVAPTRVLKVKQDLKVRKERLDKLNEQEANANKLFKDNKDACMKRRDELKEIISQGLPTTKDVEKRRVNPRRLFEQEKKKGFGELKKEFQILSHLADEEANTKFLQRDTA